MEKLLTISEVAALINVHPETLRRWDRDGTLVAIKVNDRGDRRYRESDLMEFMKTHKGMINYAQPINYSGYTIKWWNDNGFNTTQGNFDLMAKIFAINNNEFIGFIFYVSFINKFKFGVKEDDLDKLAIDTVKECFDAKKASDGDRFTFEFDNAGFYEVQNPEWWGEKYSRSLIPGLRVTTDTTVPTTAKNVAWRVSLRFKSKSGNAWVTNTFGINNAFSEYFVWIESKELQAKGLPNTAKAAEIVAINFGIKRFNETKDENGDRDIMRIEENNAACFEGKWVKNSWLPDQLM